MSSLADLPDLTGFFSYSRRDDENSQGSLSRLRAQILSELRLQLGSNLRLWQDTEAIPDGAEWEGEIKKAISESLFFIPIVTPSSVASKHCHMELEAFLDREETLGRNNLVFPLLYVRVPALEKDELWRQDPALDVIGRRNYFDWQKFRYRSVTEGEIAERIGKFCQSIVESLQQPWVSPEERRAAEAAEAQRMADRARRIAEQAARDQEEKNQQQAEAEARQQVERQDRAAEEAEKRRIAEQMRRDQQEKDRQRAEAEALRQAEQQRRAAAKAQRIAEKARLNQETKKRQQAKTDAWLRGKWAQWAALRTTPKRDA
jgi:flagellar biosynthesis GTPase FlhF